MRKVIISLLFAGYIVAFYFGQIIGLIGYNPVLHSYLLKISFLGLGFMLVIAAVDRPKSRPSRTEKKWRAKGMCEVCGYDLRGTPNQCPECGTYPPESKIRPQ